MLLILGACLFVVPPAPATASDAPPEGRSRLTLHRSCLLGLEPGTPEEAILGIFGRPSCWGGLRTDSSGGYCLGVEWMHNFGRGPTGIAGELTWFYPLAGDDRLGRGYFVVLRDHELVRVFRGILNGWDCD
jgi:hypothetical protein